MRVLTWVLIVMAVLYGAYLFQPTSKLEEPTPALLTREKPMEILGIQLREFDGERLQVEIEAEKAAVYEKLGLTELERVQARFLSENPDQPPVVLQAPLGKYQRTKELFELFGGVHVQFSKGRELRTSQIQVDQSQQLITGSNPLLYTAIDARIEAQSFRYSLKTEDLQLASPRIQLINY